MLNVSLADYGVGNLHSLRKSLENCGARVRRVTDMGDLLSAECIAFPGVGAFDRAMERLLPVREGLAEKIAGGTPCIGICIGTQILFGGSDEGGSPGIGFIDGRVERLRARTVPHMGWNSVETDSELFDGIDDRCFYFAHSYFCNPADRRTVAGTSEYEGIDIPVLFRKGNFVGTQFHPEKSSASGMRFLTNFIRFAEERK